MPFITFSSHFHSTFNEFLMFLCFLMLFQRSFNGFSMVFPQTGTVGVLNSYYNGSMDKMIRGPDPR